MAITTITNAMVSVNAIQGTLIADNAITAVHIATNAVSGTLIADNAVTATHIAQNTITVTQLADDAVEADKIADGVITTNHLNKAMISSQTEVTPVAGDFVLIGDTSDSNNLKKTPISGITALATVSGISSSADATAITIGSDESVDFAKGIVVQGSGTTAGVYLNGTNSDSITQGNFIRYGTNFATQSNAANSSLITYAFNGSTFVNALNIKSDGKVGIGETSPAAPLHVEHSSGTAYNGAAEVTESLIVSNKAGTDDSGVNNVASIGLHVADGATSQGFINYVRTGNNTGNFTFTQRTASTTYAEAMRIDSSGNIGIGTTSPDDKLDIMGGGYDQIRIGSNKTDNTNKTAGIISTMYTNNSVSVFQGFFQNGSNAIYYGSADTAHRGINQHYFYTNSDYNATSGHKLRYLINGTGKHTFYGKHQGDSVGHFLFTNNSSEDASNTNCSLAVQNGGTFLQIMAWTTLGARIGTRTGGWNSTGSQGTYLVAADATNIICTSGGSPTLANGTAISSDERLKENIIDIGDGQLAKILNLRPRTFTWKDTRKTGTQEGFIAQEVESVMPEAVEEREVAPDPDDTTRDFGNDIKVLKHEVINARLIKAVQELSAELDAAKARISALEG